ncbi:LPS O-antigen length regulator [Colwellia sp. D2M02]|uniref:Wzz/FepE/Etk N-terminal domain-containing protein n=1 Tax=Colwellia sp. D2M02 TaxID=2841562 RepID=UPI001C091539|nr:Wzz/FepE/Etk N-terminal domain-containing protein [Colwellia sp. D2M02]MBU2891924.1 LPS O-antigen length regulator [Colwellia sp. D2M02]
MKHELSALETSSDIVSFKKLFRIIFRMKWFILLTTLAFAAASVYYAKNMPNVYTAKGMFVPAKDQSGGGLSQLAGQFGGLASMAGINLGGGSTDETEVAVELLQSRSFLQAFIEKRKILPELLAGESWDQTTKTFIYDETIYDSTNNKWVRGAPPSKAVIPTPWEGYYSLKNLISVEYLRKKGVVNISLTYLSPELSAKWLGWLIADLNSYWRSQEKKLADDSIDYLNKQIERTTNAEMRTIFYTIIAEQTKQNLLAEVRKEYLFKTLAPIVVPEDKSAPSRALLCVVGTFFGALFSLVFSFVYASMRPVEGS